MFLYGKFLFQMVIFLTHKFMAIHFIPKVIIPECHCSERLLFLKVLIPKFEMFKRCLERDCLEY